MVTLLTTLLVAAAAADAPRDDAPADPLAAMDVTWTSPSRDEHGSMPIGNGDLAANAWWNDRGELWLYLSKTDAWDDNGRLLKLGRLVVTVDPPPATGEGFRQRLDLRRGEIACSIGRDDPVRIRVRVDANRPVLVVDVESGHATSVGVRLEHWRTEPHEVKELSWSDVYCVDHGAPGIKPTITSPDVFVPVEAGPRGAELAWYHRNERTPIPDTFRLQGLESLLPTYHDPILHRAFGCLVTGPGLVGDGDRALRSGAPATTHRVEVWASTARDVEGEAFLASLRGLARDGGSHSPERALDAHRRWWDAFWERSWIRIDEGAGSQVFRLPDNARELRIGRDSSDGNRFGGSIDRLLVYGRSLGAEEIAAMRTGRPPEDAALAWAAGGPDAVPDDPTLDGCAGLTVAAWITPGAQAPGGGRIVDKATVGAADGWLLDTYPGNSLRFLAGDGAATADARLVPGTPVFVAGTYDARDGRRRLFLDGQQVAETKPLGSAAETINRAYALQRYVAACAGRGGSPIKFNGSLFTVPRSGEDGGDPDWRKWGPGYWFQNTRLIYWPMLASGDLDMMEPFFAMYRDALPLSIARSATVEAGRVAPGGAAFHETIAFWGLPDNASFGWRRGDAPAGEVLNPYIRHYRSGSIELLALALDRYDHRRDESFARTALLPLADAILAFYASAYPREADGTIRFEPAASLETWHDATNPLPEIAGLRFVLPRLLALDAALVDGPRRTSWSSLLAALPPLPAGPSPDGAVLLPAARFASLANIENPELYAIFPYRLFGVGKADLDLARRTFARRANRNNVG